jgi:hypothetical protein
MVDDADDGLPMWAGDPDLAVPGVWMARRSWLSVVRLGTTWLSNGGNGPNE